MMRLYATTTSERASKSQGGNNFIETEYTLDQEQYAIVNLAHVHGGLPHTDRRSYQLTIVCDENVRLVNSEGAILYDTPKGNKQKGEQDHPQGWCAECQVRHS